MGLGRRYRRRGGVVGGEGAGNRLPGLRVEHNRLFEMLLDSEINANALNWAQSADKARTQRF